MNSKLIASLAVAVLAFAAIGGIFATDVDPDADDTKYLTVIYDGIIDPADVAVIGTPASAIYKADVIAEPETYAEGKQFDLIAPFVVGDEFIVPMSAVVGWSASEKTNYLAAFGTFAGPISTEVKFVAPADKTVKIANLADVADDVAKAVKELTEKYEAQIADLNATITAQTDKIAELEAALEVAEGKVKADATQTWQIISLVLGALFILAAIFGGRAIVLVKRSGGKLF